MLMFNRWQWHSDPGYTTNNLLLLLPGGGRNKTKDNHQTRHINHHVNRLILKQHISYFLRKLVLMSVLVGVSVSETDDRRILNPGIREFIWPASSVSRKLLCRLLISVHESVPFNNPINTNICIKLPSTARTCRLYRAQRTSRSMLDTNRENSFHLI